MGQLITVENGSCTEVGMQLYDADGTLVAEAFREPGNSGKVWFCLNDDCDYQLEPATRYSYCFYAVVDGNTYWGEEQEFRSAGDYLSLDRSELYLVSGSSAVICADYQPADAVVDWHSSNRSVATVKDGLVSAVEPGTAVISARVGTAYAKCTVTVTGSPAAAGSEGAGSAAGVHFKAVAAYEEGQFSDVTPEQWFYASVVNGYELGLIKGSAASLFNPDGQVSLAEAVTMACRIHSTYTGKELLTEASPWYQPYLDYAYANGIINGELYQSDVTQMATRAQFAEIFAHALPDKALYPINEVDDGAVPDVDADAENAAAIYRLYRAGILSGSDAYGTFKPDSHVTRAEAAVILSRMANSDQRVEVSL